MQNLILDNIFLITLLPLWIFLIIMCGRFFSVYVNKKIIYTITLCASLFGALICTYSLSSITEAVEVTHRFIQINDFSISCGMFIDKISLSLGLLLYAISFAVQLFSVSYMKNEEKNYRFFALLNLFNFSMSGLIFSPNLFQLYVFWELVSIVSYLLIGFEYKKSEKSIASQRVFIVNRIGDTALLAGILFSSFVIYNYSGNPVYTTLSISDLPTISTILTAFTSTPLFLAICTMYVISSFVKSAQFPFHIWLQDAMEAKLPVSALLHSATMVTAGIYLSVRLFPILSESELIMKAIAAAGLFTAILCAVLASFENHPKKILAYSTSANLGLMFFALGLGSIKTALILLSAHAVIKALLFITLPKEDKTVSKITFGFFVISSFSLAGILFAGCPVKETLYNFSGGNTLLKIGFLISVFFTALYTSRLAFLIFKTSDFYKKINPAELFANASLLIMNIFIYLAVRKESCNSHLPLFTSSFAIILTAIMYKFNLLDKFPRLPKLAEKIGYVFLPDLYSAFTNFCKKFEENIFENYKPLISLAKSGVKIAGFIEDKIMNNSVKLATACAKIISNKDAVMQSGNVQTYNAYAFIIITIISVAMTFLIIGYTLIMMRFGG